MDANAIDSMVISHNPSATDTYNFKGAQQLQATMNGFANATVPFISKVRIMESDAYLKMANQRLAFDKSNANVKGYTPHYKTDEEYLDEVTKLNNNKRIHAFILGDAAEYAKANISIEQLKRGLAQEGAVGGSYEAEEQYAMDEAEEDLFRVIANYQDKLEKGDPIDGIERPKPFSEMTLAEKASGQVPKYIAQQVSNALGFRDKQEDMWNKKVEGETIEKALSSNSKLSNFIKNASDQEIKALLGSEGIGGIINISPKTRSAITSARDRMVISDDLKKIEDVITIPGIEGQKQMASLVKRLQRHLSSKNLDGNTIISVETGIERLNYEKRRFIKSFIV